MIYFIAMVLSLSISDEAEATLKAKAAAAGTDVTTYAGALLEQSAKSPLTLAEISGPIAADFEASGMTEEELVDLLEAAKHEMRAERRARQTP